MRMINKHLRRQGGFTLIELLLYIGIFSLIISTIVGLIFLSTAKRVQNQTRADLNYQGQQVISLITQTIHQAESINTPAPGSSSTTLSLAMDGPPDDPVIFDTNSTASYVAMQITEGSQAAKVLTNSRVSVSNLKFTNMSWGAADNSILIQFDLSYNNRSERKEFNYSRSFSSGATIP